MKYPDPKRVEKLQAFDRLLTIMDELRNECPWDKKPSNWLMPLWKMTCKKLKKK
jgi:uncharacterized protein YabN with tetrapyrrole methylase and pyrophosphatase domain